MVTPVESFWLRWHADHSPEPFARRARVMRLAASGAPPEAIAAALGISEAFAVDELNHFGQHHLGDFPRPALVLEEVLSAAQVDLAHARHVADLALALFDSTRSLHRLPGNLRHVLETAALLHNVGLNVDEPQHHTAGRDLLRGMDLVGYTPWQQSMIACAVGLHRKKVALDAAENFTGLSRARQRQALALAALLRAADGLDYSQSQSTQLQSVVIAPEAVTLRLSGPEADGDAARARKKADLWRQVFHLRLETASAPPPPPDLQPIATLALGPEALTSDVARRALALHLLRWQANEAAALNGDPQALKSVRVSARRMRAALELFGGYFKKKPVKRLRRSMREVEALSGEVRDLVALLTDVRAYQAEGAANVHAADLNPLVAAWEKERQAALEEVRAWLGGPEASDLQAALLEFIVTPPLRGDEGLRVGMGEILQPALRQVAEMQAAVAPDRPKSYHSLRLAIKRLRYALEFFSAALGPEAQDLIRDLIRLQDRLGALNDLRLLQKRLTAFLDTWAEQQARRKAPQLFGAQGLLEYSRARRQTWEEHLAELRVEWAPVRAARLRRRVKALSL